MEKKIEIKNIKKIILTSLILGLVGLTVCSIQANNTNIKKLEIISKKKYVYPLGNVIGIKADTDGVLVVGYEDSNEEYIGGIKIGDNIVKIDSQDINNIEDVSKILNKAKENKVNITFERNGEYKTEEINIKDNGINKRLGLWVRNKVSGLGTITFYDPKLCKFNAIGHAITDVDTSKLLKIKQGYIYKPKRLEIVKGSKNEVGKIKGEFDNMEPIGKFSYNSTIGINGTLEGEKEDGVQLIEVGNRNDAKIGKAYILFEDKNRNITSYEVRIKNIITDKETTKNLVIEVIDKKLIDYTGGIVQGMSGAPIIQNTKIIGAITHVFKDDYKKGYGIFIDEMIELDKTY